MADLADAANDLVEEERASLIAAACKPVPAGEPGVCRECGDYSQRLVHGECAFCRDGR